MTTQTPATFATSPVDAVAAALLADVAFALRMARQISNEIRSERSMKATTRTPVLTNADNSSTLVA
ncbi:hypothetical protein BH11PLA2_BH11PLA2_41900 [soil metagenome]